MNKKEFNIISDCDGLPLSVAVFEPEGNPKGIFQISHGMSEHKERYYDFMEFLTDLGYITVIHDHRGHGKSVKNNEDLGFFYDGSSVYIVEDLHQITLYIKKLYPDKDTVLFGHSMGSMVVRKYIKKYDKDIDKLIVCGSPSKNSLAGVAVCIVKIMEIFKGKKYRSRFIHNLAFGGFNRKITGASSDNAWVCSNDDTVKKYDSDELCGFIFTLNGFENLFKLMRDIYSKRGWALNNKGLPIFFTAGSDDPVIINKDKWEKSQDFLKKLGYSDVKGKLYRNLRHEILNEKNKNEIYQDIVDFINHN